MHVTLPANQHSEAPEEYSYVILCSPKARKHMLAHMWVYMSMRASVSSSLMHSQRLCSPKSSRACTAIVALAFAGKQQPRFHIHIATHLILHLSLLTLRSGDDDARMRNTTQKRMTSEAQYNQWPGHLAGIYRIQEKPVSVGWQIQFEQCDHIFFELINPWALTAKPPSSRTVAVESP